MGYYLKDEKGGLAPERTYEFEGVREIRPDARQSGKGGKKYRNASSEAQRRIEYKQRTGKEYRTASDIPAQTVRRQGSGTAQNSAPQPPRQTYHLSSSRNIRSGSGYKSEMTYQFSNVGQPQQKVPSGNRRAVRYVTDKNGKQVIVHSQAELVRIRREREIAIQNEQKRILEEARAARAEQNMRTVKASSATRLSVGFIAAAVVCTAMLSVMILNMVLLNERNHEIGDLQSELESIIAKKSDLQEALEKKNDLIYIEEYAVNRLGMVKSDRLSRQYISIATADKIELVGEESSNPSSEASEASEAVKSTLRGKIAEFWDRIS